MATKEQRRQKQLERKKAKRKAVHKDLVRQKQGGLATEFARIANAPILDCLVADSVWEQGMGMVLLSRELRNGQVAFANFLVDAYCLGVKDVHAEFRSKPAYRDDIRGWLLERGSYQDVSPSHLRKHILSERCGLDNFHYTVAITAGEFDAMAIDGDVIDGDVIDAEEWEEVVGGEYLE